MHSALAEQIRAAFIEGTSEGQGSLLTLCCQYVRGLLLSRFREGSECLEMVTF